MKRRAVHPLYLLQNLLARGLAGLDLEHLLGFDLAQALLDQGRAFGVEIILGFHGVALFSQYWQILD